MAQPSVTVGTTLLLLVLFALLPAGPLSCGSEGDREPECVEGLDPAGDPCEGGTDCVVTCTCDNGFPVSGGACNVSQGICLSPDGACEESCENVGSEWSGEFCREIPD